MQGLHLAGAERKDEVLHDQGELLLALGKVDDAARALRRATEVITFRGPPWSTLGKVLEKQGRLEEVMTAFRHAIRIRPKDTEAYRSLVELLRKTDHVDEADLLEAAAATPKRRVRPPERAGSRK